MRMIVDFGLVCWIRLTRLREEASTRSAGAENENLLCESGQTMDGANDAGGGYRRRAGVLG